MAYLPKQITHVVSQGLLAGSALLALGAVTAFAQQITGTPGSPSATTTIEGNQLPPPPSKFELPPLPPDLKLDVRR